MALHTGDPFLASPPLPIEQLSAAVTQRRVKLVTLGYQPIPVLSGRKRPALPGWEETPTDLETVSAWADQRPAELSTGIRTRTTPAFDIDIRDAKVADEVEQALRSILPEGARVLKRVGLAPKRLIPMRCVTPFKKISATFKAPDGVVHKVEVLADGQQFVAEGIHEDTKLPYQWDTDLLSVAREHLPLIDEQLARSFIARARVIMSRARWTDMSNDRSHKSRGLNGGEIAARNGTKARSSGSSIYGRTALR